MAVITIHSDFRAQEEEICHYFHIFPSICHEIMGLDAMILVFCLFVCLFLIFSFKPTLSLFSFTLSKRLCNSFSLSAIRVVSSTYLRLLMFLPPILIPAYNSSSLAMMCSAYIVLINMLTADGAVILLSQS